jgi:ATP-dependent Clp protease ATP-binding subunit ClpC
VLSLSASRSLKKLLTMSSHTVPVLLSRYGDDIFTARVIDGPQVTACATTAAEAFGSVRDQLRKIARSGDDEYWPSASQRSEEGYSIERSAVTVRLFYRVRGRQFPASRELRLPVRCVIRRYSDKSIECLLPDFEIAFFCPTPLELTRLIEEQVRSSVAGLSSGAVMAAALPVEDEIRMVRVRLRESKRDAQEQWPTVLTQVASPMAQRSRKNKPAHTTLSMQTAMVLTEQLRNRNVILVGPTGCGKTTTLRSVAANLQEQARATAQFLGQPLPAPLIWQTSAENLIAGMAYLGQWEERLEAVIAAAQSIAAGLTFGSLIDLVRLGGSGPADSLASFMLPFLRRGELRIAAEATEDEVLTVRRLLPGFVDQFEIVRIDKMNHETVTDIVRTILTSAGRNHRIEIAPTAANLISTLMARFTPYEAPPRAAVEVTGEIVHRATHPGAHDVQGTRKITTADVVTAIMDRTGIPEFVLRDDAPLSIDDVRQKLSESVIGQDHAVDIAAGVVLRVKAGLCDPQRPIATMLFCGPTGVGKTQLARSLADYLFGAGDRSSQHSSKHSLTSDQQPRRATRRCEPLLRLDMSEYGGYDGVQRLTIADDGEVADWIGKLRNRPLSVLLLDEFEKASPEVHDLWLSALDEGRLTDRFGRTTSLCGTIVILTSNVGAARTAAIGFSGDDPVGAKAGIDHAIRNAFRPEFLNRLDDIVTFGPLPTEVARQIVSKELQSLSERETLKNQRIRLSWSDALVDDLVSIGFDPQLGARPLQRAIEQNIVPKIARQILARTPEQTGEVLSLELESLLPLPT